MKERRGTLTVCVVVGVLYWALLGQGGYESVCHDIARAEFAAQGLQRAEWSNAGSGIPTWDWVDLVRRGAELEEAGRC